MDRFKGVPTNVCRRQNLDRLNRKNAFKVRALKLNEYGDLKLETDDRHPHHHHHHHPSHHQNHLLYQVRALEEGGSLKLEPADLAVGSTFDASSSYRKYILSFSSDNVIFCNLRMVKNRKYRKIFLNIILGEHFLDCRNFKAAKNSSSNLAAEATEVFANLGRTTFRFQLQTKPC